MESAGYSGHRVFNDRNNRWDVYGFGSEEGGSEGILKKYGYLTFFMMVAVSWLECDHNSENAVISFFFEACFSAGSFIKKWFVLKL